MNRKDGKSEVRAVIDSALIESIERKAAEIAKNSGGPKDFAGAAGLYLQAGVEAERMGKVKV